MKVTTQLEYGLCCIVALARLQVGDPASASDIAQSEKLPRQYVEKLLCRLKRSGIVRSVRGAKGGYLLARHPSELTVRDICDALDGGAYKLICEEESMRTKRCIPVSADGRCSLRFVWTELGSVINSYLGTVTVDALLSDGSCHTGKETPYQRPCTAGV
ncbi:MAG: Rrf2 family transcriptional regulator [Candidatus Omnitrophica bacterium]|nr:Rrf2 family transcriptional regulator [Candidatus Omnitrophota bacterium]